MPGSRFRRVGRILLAASLVIALVALGQPVLAGDEDLEMCVQVPIGADSVVVWDVTVSFTWFEPIRQAGLRGNEPPAPCKNAPLVTHAPAPTAANRDSPPAQMAGAAAGHRHVRCGDDHLRLPALHSEAATRKCLAVQSLERIPDIVGQAMLRSRERARH